MVESPASLDVLWNMWVQGLAFGRDPVYDGTFHAFRIVRTRPIYAFLNLGFESGYTTDQRR